MKTLSFGAIAALLFDIPAELKQRLDAVSAPERTFPYTFFGGELQGIIHGCATVESKRQGYFPLPKISGTGADVSV